MHGICNQDTDLSTEFEGEYAEEASEVDNENIELHKEGSVENVGTFVT
jgi:hypothetical protein